jgi:transposase-like protein
MPGRRYSAEDKAQIIASLEANDGNVKRTARELDVPEQTVRDLKRKAEKGQLPATVSAAVPAAMQGTLDEFERIRNKALVALEMEVDDFIRTRGLGSTIKGKDLITMMGVLTDKIRLMQGQATSRHEAVSVGPTPEEIGEAVAQYLGIAFENALEREADIEDAEFEEQADREAVAALPVSTS